MLKFADNLYIENYKATIGIDFKCKKIKINDLVVKLQVWDTAGQERFRTISQTYYKRADGVILAYDCTNAKSFENLSTWLGQINDHSNEGVQKIIVGTKCDVDESKKAVNKQNAEKFAQEQGLQHYETSALKGSNVELIFSEITQLILNKRATNKAATTTSTAATANTNSKD